MLGWAVVELLLLGRGGRVMLGAAAIAEGRSYRTM